MCIVCDLESVGCEDVGEREESVYCEVVRESVGCEDVREGV